MSSLKNDPKNYPPEPGSGKENSSNNQTSSSSNSKKKISCIFLNIDYSFVFLDDDPNQQQPPISPPVNPRILIAVFFLSLILAYITSSREKQRETDGLTHGGYISWNEFVQDMLSKGEVS
jgi:hypothetical protein